MPVPEMAPQARRAPARVDHPFKGIALVLLSTVFLGCSDTTAKYLSASLPSIEITWIRFVTFALMFTPVMLPGSPLHAMRTERLGLQLMRGAVAYQGTADFERYLTTVFNAMWVDELDMGQPDVVGKVLAKGGFDPAEVMAKVSDPAVKEQLKAATEEAIGRGVFGAPTFFVGDEMFFGQDRLDFVEAALAAD